MENFSVAVMTAINDLAVRHGIKPYEFVAVLDTKVEPIANVELRFESPPDDPRKGAAFDRMLNDLGVPDAGDDMPRLRGSEGAIWTALESALARAPKRGSTR